MFRKCVINTCNTTKAGDGVTLHGLPESAQIQQEWFRAILNETGQTVFSEDDVICSKHFPENSLILVNGKKELSPTAIPFAHLEQPAAKKIKLEKTLSQCSVFSCGNILASTQETRPDLVYYPFPKNTELAKKWQLFCNKLDDDFENSFVCSDHFTSSDYTSGPKATKGLKPTACPSIYKRENSHDDENDSIIADTSIAQSSVEMNVDYSIDDSAKMGYEHDDSTSNIGASSKSKLRGQPKKSTAGVRKINHAWVDDEINRLISSVEQHRGLWDIASAEYKLPKLAGWRIIVDEVGIDGVDVHEVKAKWLQLRTTFMVNLAKLRKTKGGQGAGESKAVAWKFFKQLMFLVTNNVEHSTSSTSTLHLESAANDSLIVDEFSDPSTSGVSVGNRRKRPCTRTPTPPPSPSPTAGSSSAQSISILNSAVAALHSSDTNSTFCDYLLAELRTLPEAKARTLRYKISRMMMDFIETCEENQPQLSPVQFSDEDVQGMPVQFLHEISVVQTNIGSGENASAFSLPMPQREPSTPPSPSSNTDK